MVNRSPEHAKRCGQNFSRSLTILVACVSTAGILLPKNLANSPMSQNPDGGDFYLAGASVALHLILVCGFVALAAYWGIVRLVGAAEPRFKKSLTCLLVFAGILRCSAPVSIAYEFDLSVFSAPYCVLFVPAPQIGPNTFAFDGGCSLRAPYYGAMSLITCTSMAMVASLVLQLIPLKKKTQ